MVLNKYLIQLKSYKKIFNCIIFFCCYFYSIFSFAEKTQKLYINVIDLHGSFEKRLIFANENKLDYKCPVNISPIFQRKSVSYYELKRSYSPNESNKLVDMDDDEIYTLVIFKKGYFLNDNSEVRLDSNNIYKTWFSSYNKIVLRDKDPDASEITGMWPFLNTDNVKLNYLPIDEEIEDDETEDISIKSSEAINQLFEMAAAVARQTHIQNSILNQNILKTVSSKDNKYILLDVPDDYFLNYLLAKKHDFNLINILKIIYSIVSAVEYLHNSNIAHGDITLSSWFVKKSDIVLSNFERFSLFDKTDELLGTKKFTFYNNAYHAPELRYPLGQKKKWEYTNATFEGDIWSLGVVIASILYIYHPKHPEFNSLKIAPEISKYVMNAQIKTWMFKPMLYITLVPHNFLKFSIESYISISNRINNVLRQPLQIEQKSLEIFKKLFSIINSCHDVNIENRPTSSQIKNSIAALIKKYDN